VPGDIALGCAWITLCSGLSYGTISAEVVTHRMILLGGWFHPDGVYAESTSEIFIAQ
jgi:hypothetical protein